MKISESPYAPIALRQAIWSQAARAFGEQGLVQANGQVGAAFMDVLRQTLIEPMQAGAAQGQPGLGSMIYASGMVMRHSVPTIAQYELCGRHIYDVRKQLAEELSAISIATRTFAGLKLPYHSIYIHFGKQDRVKAVYSEDPSDSHEYLDGLFVAHTPYFDDPSLPWRLKFLACTVRSDGTRVLMPGHFAHVIPEDQHLPALEAIDRSLARRIEEVRAGHRGDRAFEFLGEGVVGQMEESAILLKKAMPLVLNTLTYLERNASSIRELPQRDDSHIYQVGA